MIKYVSYPSECKSVFSILIPTWNNLRFLQVCIDSIRKNSSLEHQILVHVNEEIREVYLKYKRAKRLMNKSTS
jgi:glycosyltransferase involved in cell wall biosynthesis